MAAAFGSFKGLPVNEIGALRQGSMHLAYDAATKTYWGTASFLPARRDSARVAASFQDGGGIGVFVRSGATAWKMTGVGGEPFPCRGEVPSSVLTAWGMTQSGYCSASNSAQMPPVIGGSGSPIAKIAESQVGIGDSPASTAWSFDCDPYTTLVGVRVSSLHCGVSRRFGVRDRNELWCADFAKWVWRKGGISKDLRALTPAANSFYFWGKAQRDVLTPDGTNAAPGDAVVFYPDGALTSSGLTTADHVGIVAAVNSNGTVDLVNGDFLGAKNIAVRHDAGVSIASWAAGIWGANEQWMYISPFGPAAIPAV